KLLLHRDRESGSFVLVRREEESIPEKSQGRLDARQRALGGCPAESRLQGKIEEARPKTFGSGLAPALQRAMGKRVLSSTFAKLFRQRADRGIFQLDQGLKDRAAGSRWGGFSQQLLENRLN